MSGCLIGFCARGAQAAPTICSTGRGDEAKVAETMRQMYAALVADDLSLFEKTVAPGFYAFDGGKRWDGTSLAESIKTAHANGSRYVWTVTEPEVHLACNDAWIAYVNHGSKEDKTGVVSITWLESAFLHKDGGAWRIRFFHSTRAAAAKP